MIGALHIARSALHAFKTMLGTSAHNLANSETKGFKSQRAEFSETESGGVKVTITQDESPGIPLGEDEEGNTIESSNTDLITETTNLTVAQRGYEANVQVLKTAQEMDEHTLDIIG